MVLRLVYRWLHVRYGKPASVQIANSSRASNSSFELANRKLEEMAELLTTRDPTQYHVELELIAILKQLASDHQAHFKLNSAMWKNTQPHIYLETIRALSDIFADAEVYERVIDQIDERIEQTTLSRVDRSNRTAGKMGDLKELIQGEYRIRHKYRQLLQLLLQEDRVTYAGIAERLEIEQSRARGLVSEFENIAFHFDRSKEGRFIQLSIPPERYQAVQDLLG